MRQCTHEGICLCSAGAITSFASEVYITGSVFLAHNQAGDNGGGLFIFHLLARNFSNIVHVVVAENMGNLLTVSSPVDTTP